MQRKPGSRLGVNGPSELKKHYWFQETNWEDIANHIAIPPYIPSNTDNNFDLTKIDENELELDMKMQEQIMKNEKVQDYFNGYYFDSDSKPKKLTNIS